MIAPASSEWIDWTNAPLGQAIFNALVSDTGSEPVFLLMKNEGDDSEVSFIGILMADNERGYSNVSEIPLDWINATEISGINMSSHPEIKRIGQLDWVVLESEASDEETTVLSDIAVTFCNNKIVAVLLMNDKENRPENLSYFNQLVESSECS